MSTESGSCSVTNTLAVVRTGSDAIDGGTSAVINSACGYLRLESDGSAKWTVIGQSGLLVRSTHGANIQCGVVEGITSGLSGTSVTTSVQIPANCIVFAVSERVTTTITGAASFEVGVAGNAAQFGSGLSLDVGSTNYGLIGPTAFYSATSIVLTAAGGGFTAGAVRLSVHYLVCQPPAS